MSNKASKQDFLQSPEWRKFQENVGRKTYIIGNDGFSASLIEHTLPIVGNYLYCPRGPHVEISNFEFRISNENEVYNDKNAEIFKVHFSELLELARKNDAGWIRIEPENEEILKIIKENISEKIIKAPHDMQPREIFVIDISKTEEQLLAEMKSKTRYNINLAKKREVIMRQTSNVTRQKDVEAFLKLTKEMAERNGIATHPEEYYRKMIESLPEDILKIYVAEYDGPASTGGGDRSSTRGGKIIAANLVLFYEQTAIYLHGASGNDYRNVMAPFLLQWQAILDAKEKGCKRYDMGGVKITNNKQPSTNNWEGITQFKLGFSPQTNPIVYPGTYDIVINSRKYGVYRGLQRAKALLYKIRK